MSSPSLSEIKSEHSDGVIRQNWSRKNASDGLNSSRRRRILVQGKVCSRAVVIGHIRKKEVTQESFAEDDDMVKTFPPD